MPTDIGWGHGWAVFNDTSATTSNTVLYTDSTTWDNRSIVNAPYVPSNVVYYDPLMVEAGPRPEDPLAWLHRRVEEIVDLGRLN
jgi:hypothetical protein